MNKAFIPAIDEIKPARNGPNAKAESFTISCTPVNPPSCLFGDKSFSSVFTVIVTNDAPV